ncbi:cytosine permease [Moorella naiadis]|uniref:cytosine permease n=1 Tax=Moorella naiadis (nom. illeg.) TaxID=3093670 RepID=UPI003D9C9778
MAQTNRMSLLLWNEDIAPIPPEKRTWGSWTLFGIWASIAAPSSLLVGSVGITFGYNWWQVLLISLFGDLITLFPLIVQAHGATKYGLAEPQLDRSRFGIWGTFIPSWARFFVGMGFWGVQTFLITEAVVGMLLIIAGQQQQLASFGALTPAVMAEHYPLLFWGAFLSIALVQYFILIKARPIFGSPSLKVLGNWMPSISIATLTIVFLYFIIQYRNSLGPALHAPAAPITLSTLPIFLVYLVSNIHSTQVISWPDMMRFARSMRSMILSQIGLPVVYTITVLYGALMTGIVKDLTGKAVYDPILLVASYMHPSALAALILLIYAGLLMNTNIFSNSVPPVYDLCNTWPQYLNWNRGVMVVTVLGIAVGAWSLYAQGAYVYFNTWILLVASLLGPVAGIIVADYLIIHRGHIDVEDLYRIESRYYYWKGFNIAAFVAMGLALLLIFGGKIGLSYPGWLYVNKASWLSGFFLSIIFYLVIKKLFPVLSSPKGSVEE